MNEIQPRILQFYCTSNGNEPFNQWYRSISDSKTKYRIQRRLERLAQGNLGDSRPVGDGVNELRLHFGPGYRIYFVEYHNRNILVLCGGDKSSQKRDIERAKSFWQEYKERQT